MNLYAEIEIEKGIPIPYIRSTFSKVWDKMQNGDSFKVPDRRQRQAAIASATRAGHKVTSVKINGAGYRIWLIEKAKS